MESNMVESIVFVNAKDALPIGLVKRGISCEGERAAIHVSAHENRMPVQGKRAILMPPFTTAIINSRNMKKIVLAAVILLSSLTPALAQHSVGSISIKPMVGLNIANITDLDDSDPRYGVAAGAEFEYQATDMFSLSFGALYSMQGAKGSLSYKGASVEATCKEDYINIPILANVYVAKGLAVKLGLQPGFNVNDKYHVKAGFAGFSGSGDFDPDEIGMPEAKSVDLSIPVGLSYEYSGFVLDARYN